MKRNLKIKTKILLFFNSCLLLIFCACFLFIHFVIRPQTVKETLFSISQVNESKASEVDSWVTEKTREYRIISAIPAFSSMDTREITPLIDRFTSLYMKNNEVMETFTYIGKNGFCWINSEATENLMNEQDYRRAYTSDKEFIIGLPTLNQNNREVLMFYYPILGYGNEKEALICSAVPAVSLKGIVNTEHIYHGKTWVMNRTHDIISTNKEYFYQNYLSAELLETIETDGVTSSVTLPVTDHDGTQYTLFMTPVSHYDEWLTCTIVANKELYRPTDELLRGYSALFVVLFVLTGFLGLFLNHLIMKPVRRLSSCMNHVDNGNLQVYYDTESNRDEIYELGMSYNRMLDRIRELIERIYKEQEAKRRAEAAVMQAQIKPHFLYNTLDNLKWMAKEQGADEVASTITSLSTFFRIFLSNGKEMISIADEFKHTKAYLDIQSIRYREKLSYSIELEDSIRNYRTPKILIQPMVENAIYHGIKPKDGKGHIQITGKREGDLIVFIIRDDGVGMTEEQLDALRNRLEKLDSSEHFGMVNTLTRLRAIYGPKSDITVTSVPSAGTTITITFQITEEQPCIEQS